MQDWRRMNVAFTRAKRKLLVFGSLSTFEHSQVMGPFLTLVQEQGWVYHLPPKAQDRVRVDPVDWSLVSTPKKENQHKLHEASVELQIVHTPRNLFLSQNILKDQT
jgi:ATP-dependent exoDNAse (exonuclease V) beta subunit